MNASIPLSKLVSGKVVNARRVKPEREAHRRLVASIRAFDLLEPLVVRPVNGHYEVIAGNRRLAALKEVHKNDTKEFKVPCQVREADETTAKALSLAENFAAEGMHPLDEAERFAELAGVEGKDAETIASQFGVSDRYIRQRMKLATLAGPIKAAYREGKIDTGTAEAFTSVPEDRQLAVWKEVNGSPRHAEHVRNIIAAAWIDASHALFVVTQLPEGAVSRDLFGERVLVERSAFMEAQAGALVKERDALMEHGWKEVVIGTQADVQDRLWAMNVAEVELDAETKRKLDDIRKRWEKLEAKITDLPEDDEAAAEELQGKLDALDAEAEKVRAEAPKKYAEATKAAGTVFLMLDASGQVRREYRVPKRGRVTIPNGAGGGVDGGGVATPEAPPTSEDLSASQLAATYTHHALAVRQAVLNDRLARKRVLVMILHEKVRSEALAVKQDANGTTLHVDHSEGFASAAWDELRKRRAEVDPFVKETFVEDVQAYKRLCKLGEKQLDNLIELLTVECLTAHPSRPTQLVQLLAGELKVNLRDCWRPDVEWLGSYQKVQLAHLITELQGPMHKPSDDKKKSELVASLAKLFADAADGKLEDKKLAEKVNNWVPSNFRPEPSQKK